VKICAIEADGQQTDRHMDNGQAWWHKLPWWTENKKQIISTKMRVVNPWTVFFAAEMYQLHRPKTEQNCIYAYFWPIFLSCMDKDLVESAAM
jgi:hypothetical protein